MFYFRMLAVILVSDFFFQSSIHDDYWSPSEEPMKNTGLQCISLFSLATVKHRTAMQ